MELSREYSHEYPLHGLLYPLMVIAAIAVIVFSIVGIATITGWMPNTMLSGPAALTANSERGLEPGKGATLPGGPRTGSAFQCTECGVIESIREIEQRGSLASASLAGLGRTGAASLADF